MDSYPIPGRGAWTLTGGLLPVKPGSTSKTGYYRAPVTPEPMIGAAYPGGTDTSHHAQVVWLGVQAIQRLIGMPIIDGHFGPLTGAAVLTAQKAWGIEPDGIVGRATMRAALTPLITAIAGQYKVPVPILGGLLVNESALDPAAVGVNGQDHGVAQINLAAHGQVVSLEQALDPDFAITFSAIDLAATYRRWNGFTKVDPWDIAIANHNSPALARAWALTGAPPVVASRPFQIAEYVAKVRTAW